MKSGQIIVFRTFLAYKHKFNFFSSFIPFYCKRPIWDTIQDSKHPVLPSTNIDDTLTFGLMRLTEKIDTYLEMYHVI